MGSGTPWAWTACCAGYCPRTAAASEWSGCSSGWSPRAIAPASKLATAAWLTRRTHIPGLTDQTPNDVDGRAGVGDDECYRARDWLIQAAPQVAREVFWSLASLLDLKADLLFFDTSSTYFEIDDADPPVPRVERGHPRPDGGAAKQDNPTDDGDGERARGAGFRTWARGRTTATTCRRSSSAWP